MTNAAYIVIDGMDGSGKGTVLDGLRAIYPPLDGDNSQRFIYTREPGGSPLAEQIRRLVVNDPMSALTELLLFVAAREDLRRVLIGPAVDRGQHVISDRSVSSTFSYQIHGRQQPDLLPTLRYLDKLHMVWPSLYVFLDLEPELAAKRTGGRAAEVGSEDGAKFDRESIDFHTRVREGFKTFPAFEPDVPCHFVDASQTPDAVLSEVSAIIATHLATFR